jgi:exonuclease III
MTLRFFTNLSNYLQTYNGIPVVIGGDWNCTFSCEAGTGNIDCLNMARPPNLAHSRKIADLCKNYNLSDPYRYLYPDNIDFSYQPRAVGSRNRSRLDFFYCIRSFTGLFNRMQNCWHLTK